MKKACALVLTAVLLSGLALVACKKSEEEPPPQQPYNQPGYGQQPAYGQQPTYTQQPVQTAPQTTQPAPQSTLSTPGPAALPCQTDATCITAKCNTAYGKCTFPCQNDNDCIAPNQCILGTGLCGPSLGTPAPAGT
jgi:hypothetical protein